MKIPMKNSHEHKDEFCNIKGCKEIAEFWFDITNLPLELRPEMPLAQDWDTFYLCDQHAQYLTGDDHPYEYVHIFNPFDKSIIEMELAVYSCSENCRTCNN